MNELREGSPEGEKNLDVAEQKHQEYEEAFKEVERINQEIDDVLQNTPDRLEAEKIVMEKWAPLLDAAMKKMFEAEKSWSDTLSAQIEKDFGQE